MIVFLEFSLLCFPMLVNIIFINIFIDVHLAAKATRHFPQQKTIKVSEYLTHYFHTRWPDYK